MLEDLGVEANNEEDEVKEVFPLPIIDYGVLRKVIDWCEQHKNDPEPEKEEESKDGKRKQKLIMNLRAGLKSSRAPPTKKEEENKDEEKKQNLLWF